jgi:hypothetical protein
MCNLLILTIVFLYMPHSSIDTSTINIQSASRLYDKTFCKTPYINYYAYKIKQSRHVTECASKTINMHIISKLFFKISI